MSLNIYKLIDKIRNLSIEGTEGVFNIQPFVVIYLYALDKIKFVKVYNIDELYKSFYQNNTKNYQDNPTIQNHI